jgi:hypothetical protein
MPTTFVVDHETATPTAQRLMVWSRHDHRIRTTHTGNGFLAFVVPDDLAAAPPAGYGTTVDLGPGNTTLVPGSDTTTTVTRTQVTGIDPNDYTTEKSAPTGLAATGATDRPGQLAVTWDYDQRHAWYRISYRVKGTTGWRTIAIPGHERRIVLGGLTDGTTYEFTIQAVVTEGHYVPIASSISAVAEGTPGGAPVPTPTATLTCDPESETGLDVNVTVDSKGQGEVSLSGGFTGSPKTNPGNNTTVTKLTYPANSTGAKDVTITYGDPEQTVTVQTPVLPCPPPPPEPTASINCTPGGGLTVNMLVDNKGNGPVTITGTFTGSPKTNAGNNTEVTPLAFPGGTTGAQTVTVKYASNPDRTTTFQTPSLPCPPPPEPTANITCNADDTDRTSFDVTVDNNGNGQVSISGDFADSPKTNAGDDTAVTVIKFPSNTTGTETITITYLTNPQLTKEFTTPTLPCPELLRATSRSRTRN